MALAEPSHDTRDRRLRRNIWIAVAATLLLSTLIALFDLYVSVPMAQ